MDKDNNTKPGKEQKETRKPNTSPSTKQPSRSTKDGANRRRTKDF